MSRHSIAEHTDMTTRPTRSRRRAPKRRTILRLTALVAVKPMALAARITA